MLDITNTWLLNISSICQLLRKTPLKCFVTLQSRDVTVLRVQSRRHAVFSPWRPFHKQTRERKKKRQSERDKVFQAWCSWCPMQYGDDDNSYDTSDEKNPMSTELKKKKKCLFIFAWTAWEIMFNKTLTVSQHLYEREKKKKLFCFLSLKLQKLCHIFMHFETALPETQC